MKKWRLAAAAALVAAFAMCLFLTLSPGSSSAQPLQAMVHIRGLLG